MSLLEMIKLLPVADWAALTAYFAAWAGYAGFARRRATVRPSLLAATNYQRERWMYRAAGRDNRMIDGQVVQSFTTSTSFFASTTILIIGGLLAVLGTSDKALELMRELPFAARTSSLVFDFKLAVLTGVFVYAFFRFSWSMRQYTFAALLVASAPDHNAFAQDEPAREAFARRAGRMAGLAAETFNDGLRAYYFSFAAVLWFFSPLVFSLATAGVIYILYQREFHSEVLAVLRD